MVDPLLRNARVTTSVFANPQLLHPSLPINLSGCSDVCVPHQVALNRKWNLLCVQPRLIAVPEGVEAEREGQTGRFAGWL